MTMKGMPVASSMPASKTPTMCSLSMWAATRASRRKRSRISELCTMCGSITLSARRRSVSVCSTS